MSHSSGSFHLRLGMAGLGLLLLVDLGLIAADILYRRGVLEDPRFLVTTDRGFGEMVQYTKAGLGALLLAAVAVQRRSPAAPVWSVLLALVALDDALMWHERAGVPIARLLRLPDLGGMRANHLGELVFFAGLGALAVLALAWTWARGRAFDRRLTIGLAASFALLGMCAVALDGAAALTRHSALGPAVAVVEDGGEMLALSLVLFTVWMLALAPAARPARAAFAPPAPARATTRT